MQTVDQIARGIVAREGGYVNDPDDPGGATNRGVTIGKLREIKPGATIEDLKALTEDEAVDIFVREYFHKPGIDKLPKALHPSVFDMQVNAGSNAVKILQRLLVAMGYDCGVDGQIGPQTARIAAEAYAAHPDYLADAYGIARRNYYYDLADRRPASRKYARRRDGGKGGWITRAEEFVSEKYRLTDAEHRERTSAWV